MDQLTVLVVEPESLVREMLEEILLRTGAAHVTGCADAVTALQACRADRFDIVMLSMGLPGWDGHTLMQDLKAVREGQHIVLVTADDSLESIQKAISGGANGYIVKPYSEETIRNTVNNYRMVHGIDDHLTRESIGN